MARNYRPINNWLTNLPDPKHKPDTRKGNRHKETRKSGFVAWDGESVSDERGHYYIMLVSSNGDVAINENGLTTIACLDLLLEGGARAKMRHHVGFAFSYDVNMLLRDISQEHLKRLWETGKIVWNGYTIHYKPRREFAIYKGKRRFKIWDVWGFFQSSFVNALHAYGHDDFVEYIASMKERRAEFALRDYPEMLRYCKLECDKLREMMEQFAGYLAECDLHLNRFDGAGAVASSLLRKYGVRTYMRESSDELQAPAAYAYFGGRIELVRYGHAPNDLIYQYDLRSAYPSKIQHLPCLACGEWVYDKINEIPKNTFSVCKARWDFSSDSGVCPFPWRDSHGAIYFPQCGEGWYWYPEILAAQNALDAGVIRGELTILERHQYTVACEHRPFDWVPELYERRAQWKRDGIGAEKVLKLGLNSLYGKTAQRVGWSDGKAPPWHQLEWAGYVTSATRASLYEASFPAILSGDLIAYATDAIFTTAPLDLPCTQELGAWELDVHNGGTFVQSGVYWLDNERIGHTRGFGKDDLHPNDIVKAWRKGETEIQWKLRRFVGMGRALRGGKQWTKWRRWEEEEKGLSLTPLGTKRILKVGEQSPKPHKRLVLTIPAPPHFVNGKRLSAPIRLPWLPLPNAYDSDSARAALNIEDESDSAFD